MKTKENEVKITFTMVDDKLLSTPISRITAQQKLLISWVLRFQKNKLECFASNKTIADTFGMSKDGVKSLLKSCSHSFPTFFTCTPDTRDNGVPFHTISIDLEKLMDFIVDGAPVSKIQRRNKPSTQKEAPESTIITQPIPEVQIDKIVSEIEDIKIIPSARIKIDEAIKSKAKKYFKNRDSDEHFDNQIKEMTELFNEIGIKYLDELSEQMKANCKLELKDDDGYYYIVQLFEQEKQLA